jgi:hypothetical protein
MYLSWDNKLHSDSADDMDDGIDHCCCKLGKPEEWFTASVHAQYLCFFLMRKCDALASAKCQQRLQNKDTTHAQMLKTVLPVFLVF